MKIQPRLLLTSFCTLLASTALVEAQTPQPRFGYGSVPRGAYVIPAPKTAPAPVSSKPKPKPAASTSAKPKPVSTTTKSRTVASVKPSPKLEVKSTSPKTSSTKSTAKAAPVKSSASKTASKAIVSAKTKSSSPKSTARPEIAKVTKSLPARAKTTVKSTPIAKSAPSSTAPAKITASTLGKTTFKTELATTGPGDLTRASSNGGFNFFGSPIILPDVSKFPSTATVTGSGTEKPDFVDVMAARQALSMGKTAFTPKRPGSKAMIAKSGTSDSAYPAAAAPTIAPAALAAQAFVIQRPAPEPAIEAVELFADSTLARTAPVSLSLNAAAAQRDTLMETPLLDEPALPTPVISDVEKPVAPKVNAPPAPEPELPEDRPASPSNLPDAIATAAGDHDLSERERAFVRSLAEAAGSVTKTSGKLNQDLPVSIATAASAVMNQIPAETVSSFPSVAATAKSAVDQTPSEAIPDLPMEISNDLMPAIPDKMPDQLPAFNAASSGKIDVQSDRQADYDQANNKVIFTGKVELNSAAIRLRAERVEVFMKKGGGGMERVEASGNVLMRTQDTASGPGQMASAGRALYNLKTGEITLSDWPKIQETGKSHISTAASTKMYMFTDGRLRTDGPNRTLIGGG